MLSAKIKNLKVREKFYKSEKLRILSKFLFTNFFNSNLFKNLEKNQLLFLKKEKFHNSTSKVKITRRCVFNNRSRGVIRPYGISRIFLRELLQFGAIPGYSKAVW